MAGQGIRELREGVERAAASVLGDETEVLRRAHQTVDELARQLQDEMERSTGRRGTDQDPNSPTSPDTPDNESGTAQRGSGQTAPSQPGEDGGERNARQAQSSDQRGEQQPGQGQQPGAETEQTGSKPEGSSGGGSREPSGTDQQPAGQPPGERAGAPATTGDAESPGAPTGNPSQEAGPNRSGGEGLGGFERLSSENRSEPGRMVAPLTGGDFTEWSDRLRDVEEMVGDPQLRAEAARILDRARAVRKDLKRHSQSPNWDLVQLEISQPFAELRDRLMQEILKRTSPDALVPVDRDPVPSQYQERVRRYYEQLGSGR